MTVRPCSSSTQATSSAAKGTVDARGQGQENVRQRSLPGRRPRAAPTPTFGASCALCVHRPSIRCGRDSRPWVAPQCARVSGPAWLIPSPGRYHHAIQSRQLQGQCLRRVRANEAVRAQSSLRPGRFVCPQLDRANLRFGPPESNVRSANPPPRVQGALLRRQSIGCL